MKNNHYEVDVYFTGLKKAPDSLFMLPPGWNFHRVFQVYSTKEVFQQLYNQNREEDSGKATVGQN